MLSDFTSTNQRGDTSFSLVKKSFRSMTNHGLSECVFARIFAVEDFSSDHLVVSFSMLTKLKRLKKSGRTVYNLKKADLSGLKSALRNLSWDAVFVENDIDSSIACWYDMFLTCVDEFVPKVVIKDANRPPCIDKEVLLLIRKKNRIRRKAKLKDSVNLWERFRELRRQVKKMVNFKKRSCSLGENPCKFWSYYKTITKLPEFPG